MIKQFFATAILCAGIATATTAQYKTIVLNYDKSYFGENESLPAGKYFMLTGSIGQDVPYMEVSIYPGVGIEKRNPVYETSWKHSFSANSTMFNVPINYQLRENSEYDVLIRYYRTATEGERDSLHRSLNGTLDAYLEQSMNVSKRKIKLTNDIRQIMGDMNEIVAKGIGLYRNRTIVKFTGFSDIVKGKLDQLSGTKLRSGKTLFKKADVEGEEARMMYRQKLIDDLKSLVHSELNQHLNQELFVLVDDLYINDYKTENLKNSVGLNVGYGGAIINGTGENFNYGAAPYVGISFPFAKETGPLFLRRTSISLGAFTQNFTDVDGNKISGPIFKIPTYAAIGIRPYRFIRINLGAAFLENPSTAGNGGVNGLDKRVQIKPMVGISAEFNLSLDLAK